MDRLFIVSGEKSGDLIAKHLIATLKKQYPQIEIRGIGGESFAENGLVSLFDQKKISLMGFLEILPKIPQMLKLLSLAKKEIYQFKPQMVITIDSPGFNFRLVNSVQNARLSANDIYLAFKNYVPEKSASSSLKFVRKIQNIWELFNAHIGTYLTNFRVARFFLRVFNFFMRYLNNRYTRFAFKFALRPFYAIVKHTPFKFVLLALFGRFVAVASVLYGAILYFNAFRFLKWPIIIAQKIYEKKCHINDAKKDLSQFHKIVELRKLQSKNIIIFNILFMFKSVESSLPKKLKFKFFTKLVKRLEKFYKAFKNAEYGKAFSCKFHHVVAPSVWAYKEKRAEKVAILYNSLFCILPFEPPYFEKYGLKTVFIGYSPYFRMQEILPTLTKQKNAKMVVSVTLGSRMGEVKKHIPIVKKAIVEVEKALPVKVEWNIITFEAFKPLLLKHFIKSNILTSEHEKWQAVYSSNFIIAKSGTNVVECAFLGVPSIVYYKTSAITAFLIKKMAYIKHMTLINITAKKEILPEFTQSKTKLIGKKAINWLENPQEVEKINAEVKAELQKFSFKSNPSEVIIENIQIHHFTPKA